MSLLFPATRLRACFFAAAMLLGTGTPLRAADQPSADESGWPEIKALQKQLTGNPPKGANEIEYFAPLKARLHREAVDFASSHPNDPSRWEALLIGMKTDVFPVLARERQEIFQRHEQTVAAMVAAPDASADIKLNAERTILFQHLDHLDLTNTPQEASNLDNRIAAFLRSHPDDPKAGSLQIRRLDVLAKTDPSKVRPTLDALVNGSDPAVVASARGRLARLMLADAPLDWKFTALDRRPIDFAALRGKVILIDFWASWCPDCLRALPQVLAAYHKYQDQGFEVIGVSLDNDQDALTTFLKKHDMPWPQHFDGKGWDTEPAVHYGVRGIPDMWLVGKDGRITATGVEADEIDGKLARLLGGESGR